MKCVKFDKYFVAKNKVVYKQPKPARTHVAIAKISNNPFRIYCKNQERGIILKYILYKMFVIKKFTKNKIKLHII